MAALVRRSKEETFPEKPWVSTLETSATCYGNYSVYKPMLMGTANVYQLESGGNMAGTVKSLSADL